MEESSNGKLEEIQKVETRDGDKEIVIEDSGGLKTDDESAKEIVVNGNSKSANENHDEDDPSSHSSSSDEEGEPKEKSNQKEFSGELEDEKIVTDSVVDSVEPEVSSPSEELNEGVQVPIEELEAPHDGAKSEFKKIEGNISRSLGETNGVSADETNENSKLTEEVILPSLDEKDDSSLIVTEVVSKGIEDITLPSAEKRTEEIPLHNSSDENFEIPPTATADAVSETIEETKLQALEQNPEESSRTADLVSKEKVDGSLQEETANPGSVDNNNAREVNPEITGNQVSNLASIDTVLCFSLQYHHSRS